MEQMLTRQRRVNGRNGTKVRSGGSGSGSGGGDLVADRGLVSTEEVSSLSPSFSILGYGRFNRKSVKATRLPVKTISDYSDRLSCPLDSQGG